MFNFVFYLYIHDKCILILGTEQNNATSLRWLPQTWTRIASFSLKFWIFSLQIWAYTVQYFVWPDLGG